MEEATPAPFETHTPDVERVKITTTPMPRQRPADQLVAAMLGTACRGTPKAKGCYAIPGETNAPCDDPAKAAKGECNFKTIAVPHEGPVGTSAAHNVYNSLDIGAQIKLQLQRAVIRYGYAAAILPVYSPKVLDRHFSVIESDMTENPFNRTMIDPEALHLQLKTPYSVSTEQEFSAISNHLNIGSFRNPDKSRHNQTISNLVCPHYSRLLPMDDVMVPLDMASALLDHVADENQADIYEADNESSSQIANVFRIDESQNPVHYTAFPIWYRGKITGTHYPNPVFLSERYVKEPKKMVRKALGMLVRGMQHLHNAFVLFMIAASTQKDRLEKEDAEKLRQFAVSRNVKTGNFPDSEFIRRMVNLDDIKGEREVHLPKGAFVFLTNPDVNVMMRIFKIMQQDGLLESFIREFPGRQMVTGMGEDSPYKTEGNYGDSAVDPAMVRRIAYLEFLHSYWYENNAIGRIRKRLNFKAKLARAEDAADDIAKVISKVHDEFGGKALIDVIRPLGWGSAALEGLIIAKLQSRLPPPTAAAQQQSRIIGSS